MDDMGKQDFIPNDDDKQITPFDALQTKKIEFILDLMAFGYSRRAIVEHFMEEFEAPRTTAYNYYKQAEWEIAEEYAKDRKYHITKTLNSIDRIKKRAVAAKDFRSGLAADKMKSDLLQLTGPAINETGATDALDAGRVDPLDSQSARALAEAITHAQAAVDGSQHDAVEPEQLQDG